MREAASSVRMILSEDGFTHVFVVIIGDKRRRCGVIRTIGSDAVDQLVYSRVSNGEQGAEIRGLGRRHCDGRVSSTERLLG